MKRTCTVAIAVCSALLVASCGSTDDPVTGNSDELVMDLLGFNSESIVQCDQVSPALAEVDVFQSLCQESTGGEATPEPYTETAIDAIVQNNQKLDITINSYTVQILENNGEPTGVGTITYRTTQTLQGRRCSNDATRPCATDRECLTLGGAGTCRPSDPEANPVELLLFDFTTKDLIFPDAVPFGATLQVVITLFGRDAAQENWTTRGSIEARFDSFNNCGCMLNQGQ